MCVCLTVDLIFTLAGKVHMDALILKCHFCINYFTLLQNINNKDIQLNILRIMHYALYTTHYALCSMQFKWHEILQRASSLTL